MPVVRFILAGLGAVVAVAVVVGAVLAYLAFGATPSSSSGTGAQGDVDGLPAKVSADAPAAFRDRAPFRSCGHVVLRQGEAIAATRIACLLGSPASGRELIVTAPTVEGDTTVRYLRVGPGIDGIEVFEDATADRFSAGGWTRHMCESGRIDQYGACA